MSYFLKKTFLFYIITAFLFTHTLCFDAQKVTSHFNSIDTNSDNFIDIEEYAQLLQLQDELMDVNQDEDYYRELVDLLYEQYDRNGDLKVDLKEWIQFATDIVDENDPVYQEILEEKNQQRRVRNGHKQNLQNEEI